MTPIRLGLRANAAQFSLLVGLNALVGALVGLERSVLPLVGVHDFHLASRTAILAFVVAFGAAKALTNLVAGSLADRAGRKRLLVLGWAVALPVPALIAFAPGWWVIVVANLLLGVNQGLAWSMTVLMKIDLAGPARRGLALGLNESAGYLGVAATALASGALAASFAPRTVVWVGALAIAIAGLAVAVFFVRDTGAHVAHEQRSHGERAALPLRQAFALASLRHPVLRACSQAGLVNNLNDALAWGLAPLYVAAHGASTVQVGLVAAVYPGVWGFLQLGTGWLSDSTGRKPLIALGMLVQAGALALLVAGGGAFVPALAAAALLGLGTALVYPTLIAAVSDVVEPRDRASVVGVYRFWRDGGFVVGALLAGFVADALGSGPAIAIVAGLTALSGLTVAATPWRRTPTARRHTLEHLLADARQKIRRYSPLEAFAAVPGGAVIIDIRSDLDRSDTGAVPGSVHIPRTVLEWRLDPDSPSCNPHLTALDGPLLVLCDHGFSSSFAAAMLVDLGFAGTGDIVGGFAAWQDAGLPVISSPPRREPGMLAGMGAPEPR